MKQATEREVGGWGGQRDLAVKAPKNKTKRSEITLCGDEAALSLQQRKVMRKLGEWIKIIHSVFKDTCCEERRSEEESEEKCCRTDR